jgi:hypothetical protein
MNWTKNTVILYCILSFCAVIFLVQPVWADEGDSVLTVNEDVLLDDSVLDYDDELEGLWGTGIIIKEGGVLKINENTVVYLEGMKDIADMEHLDGFHISVEGILHMLTSDGTEIIGIGEKKDIRLLLNGGTIKITTGISLDEDGAPVLDNGEQITIEKLVADNINIVLGAEASMIDIEDGLTFKVGNISMADRDDGGTITKTGGGILQAGIYQSNATSLSVETFNILDGTVEFHGNTSISTVNIGKAEFNDHTDTWDISTGEAKFLYGASVGTLNVESGTVVFSGSTTIGTLNVGKRDEDKSDISAGTVDITKSGTIGTLNLESGTVNIFDTTTVGTLLLAEGTTLKGEQSSGKRPNLLIKSGTPSKQNGEENGILGTWSKIEGKIENIGFLTVGSDTFNATHQDTLTFEGGAHSLVGIVIYPKAVVDLKGDTTIELLPDTDDNNIFVYGTLQMSSEDGRKIYKENPDTQEIESVHVTLLQGTLEIYNHEEEGDSELIVDHINTRVVGKGNIIVGSGVTFQSGTINWLKSDEGDTGAETSIYVSGGGTLRADTVDLGDGLVVLGKVVNGKFEGDGTTIEFLKTVTAGGLYTAEETTAIAHGNATFGGINIAGEFIGNDHDLTIKYGGQITGTVNGVGTLKLESGTLFLKANEDTTISVNEWIFSDPTKSNIQLLESEKGSYAYDKLIQIKEGEENDIQTLLGVLNRNTALYRPTWEINEDDSTYIDLVNLNILSVDEYIRNEWKQNKGNVENVGKIFQAFSSHHDSFHRYLAGLSDTDFQNVLRNAMAGELVGNAYRIAMQQPANTVFRHLDGINSLRSPFTRRTRGQVPIREGFNVWFNPFGQAEQAEGDGNSYDGYDMARYGFYVGGDIELYNRAVAGVLFGYTNPYVKSDLGKITANDYTAGLYLRVPTAMEVLLNVMVGFGNQNYQYKNTYRDSKFGGSSFFSSIELSRPIPFSNFRLTPLVAVDIQSAQINNLFIVDPMLGSVLLVEPEDLDSTNIRVGLLGEVWKIRTRVQYMRQIAGNDSVTSQTTMIWDGITAATPVRSTEWGKDWLNIGIGGELLATRHWRIFADYDLDLGKRSTSHLGSLNTIFRW